MAGIQEVGWVSSCQIPLLQGNFTGILQLCLFPCFWKTPDITQFTFMDHSKALCKSVKITGLEITILQFKTTDWKTFFKKNPGIFQFVLCYLKTDSLFSEGLIKLGGIIHKSEKRSRLCPLYSQELKRIPKASGVQDHRKKPFKSFLQATWMFCTHINEKAF